MSGLTSHVRITALIISIIIEIPENVKKILKFLFNFMKKISNQGDKVEQQNMSGFSNDDIALDLLGKS